MIEILPMADPKAEQALLQKEKIQGEGARVLRMTDGSETLGYVVVRLTGETIHIVKMCVENYVFESAPDMEQYFVLDSLLRAGASYGEVHGAVNIQIDFQDFYDFFRKHGFQVEGAYMSGPMGLIVNYS